MRIPGGVTNGGRKAKLGEDQRAWLDRMASKGWTAPTWPKEYGGGGLSVEEHQVLVEEMRRINARAPLAGHGLTMIGPAILEFGTEEQCREHLPKIAAGEIRWCQGYSEPGAGSDLASLQCRAVPDGDDYIINGSKIWTSGADQADWIFSLVRTDTSKKHDGIAFMIYDMESEGVSISPIELISGSSEFCQTFFDDVRVPKKQMISSLGTGWTVGKRLLQYERTSIGGIGGSNQKVTTIDEHAMNYVGSDNGKIANPAVRDAVTSLRMDERAYQLTTRRSAEEAMSNKAPTFMSSFFKVYGTEQNKERTELLVHIMGTNGFGWEGAGFSGGELGATRNWLRSKANSIEGGTSEVMLNIIAKRILGLPD